MDLLEVHLTYSQQQQAVVFAELELELKSHAAASAWGYRSTTREETD